MRSMTATRLQTWLPWTSYPLIISAPMLGIANVHLAVEVSKAAGLGSSSAPLYSAIADQPGFIPGGFDFSTGSQQVTGLDSDLTLARSLLGLSDEPNKPLPVGVGFITFHHTVSQFYSSAVPVLEKHKPAAVWLFAPDPSLLSHREIISSLHESRKNWGLKVFVQVGTVDAAREAVEDGADVVVAQGIDAGGHQWKQGAGIISLVPEVRAMLEEEYRDRDVGLVAAGGIVNGSGAAAALALGKTLLPYYKMDF